MEIHLNTQAGLCFMLIDLCSYNLSIFIDYPWSNMCDRHYFYTCVRGKFHIKHVYICRLGAFFFCGDLLNPNKAVSRQSYPQTGVNRKLLSLTCLMHLLKYQLFRLMSASSVMGFPFHFLKRLLLLNREGPKFL